MKSAFSLVLGALIFTAGTVSAILYIPPLPERVATAESIVVGTIKLEKTEGGWHHGHIVVTGVLKGEAAVGAKIPARWKTPPPPPAPGTPRLADYTFRPTLDVPQIVLLNPKKEGEDFYTLSWGNTESPENEKAVKGAL